MKKFTTVFMGMACLFLGNPQVLSAQNRIVASTHHVTREVNVASFDHIRLNGSSEIVFTPTTGRQHLELMLPENLVDIVKVYVKDRTLVLEMKSHTSVVMKNRSRVELRVAAPMIQSATLNGSGDITFPTNVNATHPLTLTVNGSGDIASRNIECAVLTATVNGSGDINLGDVTADQLQTTVNGSGDVNLVSAKVQQADATVNGSGDTNWRGVSADVVNAAVNGSGDVELSKVQTQVLNGSVSGSGDLSLRGCSEEAHYQLKGSGDITASNLKAKHVTARIPHGSGDIRCHASESIVMVQKRNGNSISYTGNPEHVERNHF